MPSSLHTCPLGEGLWQNNNNNSCQLFSAAILFSFFSFSSSVYHLDHIRLTDCLLCYSFPLASILFLFLLSSRSLFYLYLSRLPPINECSAVEGKGKRVREKETVATMNTSISGDNNRRTHTQSLFVHRQKI